MRATVPSVTLLLCALILAACSPDDTTQDKSGNQVTARSAADDAPVATPVRVPTDEASRLLKIPAAFIGHWEQDAKNCRPDDRKVEGELTIAGDRLSLDGQQGSVSDLHQIRSDRIGFNLWINVGGLPQPVKSMMFGLIDGGKTLESQEGVIMELPIITRYRRCPV